MNEANRKSEQELERRARQLFEESVAGLDGQTRSKLAQARARAVEAAASKRAGIFSSVPGLLPVGAVAAAALAAIVFWQMPEAPVLEVEITLADDLEILLEGEELDLFEELEFYAWLLEQPELHDGVLDGDDSG